MRKLDYFIGEEFAKFEGETRGSADGVKIYRKSIGGIQIMEVNLELGNSLCRRPGNYFTLDLPDFSSKSKQKMTRELSRVIKKLLPSKLNRVLVLGMGNSEITSDSLGVKAANKIDVLEAMARGIMMAKINPGVVSVTGIESFDLSRAIAHIFEPEIIIVVDSLCTKSKFRLGTSFQVSDAGIVPGSATGNSVCDLSTETMGGVKVISIGVPVVIDMLSMLNDELKKIEPANHISQALIQNFDEFDGIFSPKDIDYIINFASEIVSRAILDAII